MLPEDCTECPICGVPMMAYSDYCDACENNAAKRLGLTITSTPAVPGSRVIIHRYNDTKTGKDAYWRVVGLLSRWAKAARA